MALLLAIGMLAPLAGCDDTQSPTTQADPLSLGLSLEGNEVATSDFRDKVVLVLFWATWCSPCERAFADLDSLWADLTPSDQLALVAVSLDTIDGALEDYLHDQSHGFWITKDVPQTTVVAFNLRAIPKYVVLDRRGYIQWSGLGYQPRDSIEAVVRAASRTPGS
jgi:thiol-disulfide isomerase/thioredoxin